MTDDLDLAAAEPMDGHDLALLARLSAVQDDLDPVPPSLTDRLVFALSLAAMDAELAAIVEESQYSLRTATENADTVTFTASMVSLMLTLIRGDLTTRIDAWVTGGGASVELIEGTTRDLRIADASGRLVWESVPHGSVRFLIQPLRAGERAVITPAIEL